MRRPLLLLFAAALLGLAPGLRGAGPAEPPALHFKLMLTRPMMAGPYVKLEPGDYDVAFEPSPAGAPHFIAVFFRSGARVATAPAQLKGAPMGFKLSDISAGPSLRGTFDQDHIRKSGEIVPLNFEVKVKTERAFYEALLTEFTVPASDAESKAPAVVTFATPRGVPAKITPTPAKK